MPAPRWCQLSASVPSAARLRQRLDALADADADAEALAAIDAFVMDNSQTVKDGVSRIYAGVDGIRQSGCI